MTVKADNMNTESKQPTLLRLRHRETVPEGPITEEATTGHLKPLCRTATPRPLLSGHWGSLFLLVGLNFQGVITSSQPRDFLFIFL